MNHYFLFFGNRKSPCILYHIKVISDIIICQLIQLQVRLCREKKSGNIYAMKKLKKSEMLRRGQVRYI